MSDDRRKTVAAILLAAGSSTRMGEDKLAIRLCGRTPIELSLAAFCSFADELMIVVSPETEATARRALDGMSDAVKARARFVYGGARRQDSVYNALIEARADIVSIHDCARCLVTEKVIEDSIALASERGSGIASIPIVDTVRSVDSLETLDRSRLIAAQTPQSFDRLKLIEAYGMIDGGEHTDDASIFRAAGNELFFSSGSRLNQKLTTREDIPLFSALLEAEQRASRSKSIDTEYDMDVRIGYGEDTHRLKEGRRLILGGVEVPFELGLDGHSDADVVAHALIDAVLGACALGDIGQHFPDSDERYRGANSLELAARAVELIRENGFLIVNLDATVIAQRPKLAPFRDGMREQLARAFGVEADRVSVKFTTPEHTGPEGRGESITCRAAVLTAKRRKNEIE